MEDVSMLNRWAEIERRIKQAWEGNHEPLLQRLYDGKASHIEQIVVAEIIEGKGVEPDIIVDNDPAREFNGIDDQLNKAIEVIKEELKTKEKKITAPPPYPKK